MTANDAPKSRVSIVRAEDPVAAVKEALDLIGGMERVIHPGDRVLIKPNFGVNVSYETGIITDPRVVDALIPACLEARPGRLVVGESSVVGFDTGRVFRALGLEGRFEKLGARLVNLEEDDIIEIPVPEGVVLKKVKMYRSAYESDVIISVPTMKTHILTGVTLGLKNMKGTLPDKMKKLMHRIGVKEKVREYELEHAIAELNSVRSPDLTLIDGLIANEGYEPGTPGIGGLPVAFNTLVAGLDPVAVDTVGAYLMGFEPGEVRHIAYAGDRKVGRADLARITVVGGDCDQLRRPFKRPSLDGVVFDFKDVSLLVGQGCSGCREASLIGLSGMSEEELEGIGEAVVVVGSHVELPEEHKGKKVYLVGNCTFQSGLKGERIEGCPPPGIHVKQCLLGRS